jgi:P27 family predicted phage terminase small subunit
MGKRGRAPQPTKLKVLRGNPGCRPLNKDEPQPPCDDGSPDPILSGDALAKWTETVPVLRDMGVWTRADRGAWIRYCVLYETFVRNKRLVDQHGDVMQMTTQNGTAYLQVSPYSTQMFAAARDMLRIETQFGLTPSSRSQVKLSQKAEDDPFEAFVKSGRSRPGA